MTLEEQRQNWLKQNYMPLFIKYNVPQITTQIILYNSEEILCHIWILDNYINIFPTSEADAFSINLEYDEIDYSLISIPINDIEYFKLEGEIYHETKITGSGGGGGGSSLGGAVLGGLIAGSAGAIIGSRKSTNPINVSSESIKHDERKCILCYKTKYSIINLVMHQDDFQTLQELIPQKEYSIVQELKKNEIVKQSQPITVISIPDQIRELAKLRDEGILTEEEFLAKKNELLSKM